MAVCPDFISSKDELDRSILNLEKETFECYYYTLDTWILSEKFIFRLPEQQRCWLTEENHPWGVRSGSAEVLLLQQT